MLILVCTLTYLSIGIIFSLWMLGDTEATSNPLATGAIFLLFTLGWPVFIPIVGAIALIALIGIAVESAKHG